MTKRQLIMQLLNEGFQFRAMAQYQGEEYILGYTESTGIYGDYPERFVEMDEFIKVAKIKGIEVF